MDPAHKKFEEMAEILSAQPPKFLARTLVALLGSNCLLAAHASPSDKENAIQVLTLSMAPYPLEVLSKLNEVVDALSKNEED